MRLSLIERYLREGNLEKAKEHAQLALDNNPSAADREQALKYLGWTTAALGDPHGGADLLDQSIALDPTDLDAKWFLANVEAHAARRCRRRAATLLRDILAQPISDTQQHVGRGQAQGSGAGELTPAGRGGGGGGRRGRWRWRQRRQRRASGAAGGAAATGSGRLVMTARNTRKISGWPSAAKPDSAPCPV